MALIMNIFRFCVLICSLQVGITIACFNYTDGSFRLHINCSYNGLTNVPQNLPENVIYLDLSVNEIEILYNGDFHHLWQLEYLDLSKNPIHTFESSAFQGLSSLLVFYLTHHQLNYSEQSVPYDVFTPLISLTNLTLRRHTVTQMKDIQTDTALWPLSTLTYLNLDTTPNMVFSKSVSNLTNLNYLIIRSFDNNGQVLPCLLEHLRNQTFSAFENGSVTYLDISFCKFYEYETGCLQFFPNLKVFSLISGRLKKHNILQVIHSLKIYENKNMSLVQIKHLVTPRFQLGLGYQLSFEILSKICIEELDLSHNNIEIIDFDIFLSRYPFPLLTKCLKRFYSQNNILKGRMTRIINFLSFWVFTNMEYYDSSTQHVFYPSPRVHYEMEFLSGLQIPYPLLIPPKMKYLNLGSGLSDIGLFHSFYIFGANNLQYFNISRCNLYDSNVNSIIIGLENLNIFDISRNPIKLKNPKFFQNFPNLTELYMMATGLSNNFLNLHGKTFFTPLNRLEILDLSFNELLFVSNDVFSPLKNLKRLNLANNQLITIPDFSSFHHLDSLILNYNSIAVLKLSSRLMLDKLSQNNPNFQLGLRGNTIYCNCQALDFILWLNETNVNLDGRNYSCIDMKSQVTTTSIFFQKYNFHYRSCYSPTWLILATGFLGLICFSLLSAFLVIKNKMKLKMFVQRLLGRFVNPLKREEFPYDVFIIYSDNIYQFVIHEMRQELEVKRKFRLNIRHRDHLYGDFKPDCILDSIQNSWKVIFILNEDILQSEMTFVFMYNCLTAMKMTTPNKIVLLLDRHLDIPASVGFFLEGISEENILTFDPEQEATDYFWHELSRILLREETP